MTLHIAIEPYRAGWAEEFLALGQALRGALGPLALRIDHIGSTAVPQLPAKDIIDIQVTVADLVPAVAAALTGRGYVQSVHTQDHVPPGGSMEPLAWAKWLFKAGEGNRPVNVHIRRAGRPNQRYPYYDVKDPVCDIIIGGAELWATACDWSPGPSDC